MSTTYGQIYCAKHKTSGEKYLIKTIPRRFLTEQDAIAVNDEIASLRALSECKYIVDIHKVYEDVDSTNIVFEHVQGRPLIDRIFERKNILEKDAKEIMRNLLTAVSFCHQKRIAIRNVTLDNIIVVSFFEIGSDPCHLVVEMALGV